MKAEFIIQMNKEIEAYQENPNRTLIYISIALSLLFIIMLLAKLFYDNSDQTQKDEKKKR
jgi:hypothetical protein